MLRIAALTAALSTLAFSAHALDECTYKADPGKRGLASLPAVCVLNDRELGLLPEGKTTRIGSCPAYLAAREVEVSTLFEGTETFVRSYGEEDRANRPGFFRLDIQVWKSGGGEYLVVRVLTGDDSSRCDIFTHSAE